MRLSIRSAFKASTFLVPLALAAPIAALDESHHHHGAGRTYSITTGSPEAQRLFDRGLELAWGFNHLEAARAFRAAVENDPSCAMCWWGVALVLGPNINAALDPQYYPEILGALAHARELAPQATDKERAYLSALEERYGPALVEDRSTHDRAYASAMRRVAHSYPDDLTAATLFAEAVMDTMPWDYWQENKEPRPGTQEFLDTLESVLRRDPTHSGANHLLIHAVEKTRPDLGIPAAERLEAEPQATGHLVHMASHIYIRVGRYDDAALVNQRAIADDDAYARQYEVPAEYESYMLHNHHMLWAALTFAGRGEESRRVAQYLAEHAPVELMGHASFGGFVQHITMMPVFDHVRFGRWDQVLAQPEPARGLLYPRALWHFARALALVRRERPDQAAAELEAMRSLAADPSLAEVTVFANPVSSLLAIGVEIAAGEVAGARGDWPRAVEHLGRAVRLEDALLYDEPPPWLPPARQWLGDLLLAAGSPAEAETIYRQDLEIYPRNDRSTAGLVRSLEAQGKDAAGVRAMLERAGSIAPGV